jgi:hypothetical protein
VARRVSTVSTDAELVEALASAPAPAGAMALVGGADDASPEDLARLERFFVSLVEFVERAGWSIVDGGTNSGIMRLVGQVRARRRPAATFRLVGVLPGGALERRTRSGRRIQLANHHPELILVPGAAFGDESRWLFAAADHLAGRPAPTLVVNGGRLTLEEAEERLDGPGQIVVVLGDSGRTADMLAEDSRYSRLRRSGRLRVLSAEASVFSIGAALEGRER